MIEELAPYLVGLKIPPRNPPEFCNCAETWVGGQRVAMPRYHSCDYIRARNVELGLWKVSKTAAGRPLKQTASSV